MGAKVRKTIQNGVAKTPVVMQLEALECGAACLTMIMGYYSKWVPLEQVRMDCGVSRDGSNAKNILVAARHYGFIAKGYKLEPEKLRSSGHFPCIVHWNFNHFIVVNGFKGNKAYINDPARGSVTMTFEEFDDGFTGVCLMFEPSDAFEPSGKPKSMLSFALKRLQNTKTAIIFSMMTGLIAAFVGMISPVFSRVFMDNILTGYNSDWLVPFIILLTMFNFVLVIMTAIQSIYNLRINGKFTAVGSASYMWKVLHLPMNFFSQRMAGDIIQRQDSNAGIANVLVSTLSPVLLNVIMTIFYLVVMIRYSLILSIVGITSVFVDLVVSRIVLKKRQNILRLSLSSNSKLISSTLSGIEMVETIKASGAERGFFEKWSGYQASVYTQNMKSFKLETFYGVIPQLVSMISGNIVMILGIWLVMDGKFTVGMIMAFQTFLSSFTSPATSLISVGQSVQQISTEMERVEDVMEYKEDDCLLDEETEENPVKLSGDITINNVSFGYSKLAKPFVSDFSLSIKKGQSIAIVGATGCGKSTISKLISGLYEAWEGSICFDGKPIKEINKDVFRSSVAVVDQDIILFEDTIANNIKMWDDSIEDFEMILAARDAQIHNDIMEKPMGYQYKLIEGGKNLSGGQKQRLEIARVLAIDPTILVLDEATSALDSSTEYEVVRAIKDRGITSIVIAHRLSTIRSCDEIIVMDDGKIVDRGTHEKLLEKSQIYRDLIAAN